MILPNGNTDTHADIDEQFQESLELGYTLIDEALEVLEECA